VSLPFYCRPEYPCSEGHRNRIATGPTAVRIAESRIPFQSVWTRAEIHIGQTLDNPIGTCKEGEASESSFRLGESAFDLT
jgi:hypothetical protein